MILALLLQIDWNKFRPEQLFGGQVLERTPAGLSIVFIIGVGYPDRLSRHFVLRQFQPAQSFSSNTIFRAR